ASEPGASAGENHDARGLLRLSTGPVPHASNRENHLGPLRITFHLRPEALYVHVDQPGIGLVSVPPHLLEENLTGEDLPGFSGEGNEEIEFQRGEADAFLTAGDLVPGDIDRQIRDVEDLGFFVVVAAKTGPHPRNELARLERLRHVVIGP